MRSILAAGLLVALSLAWAQGESPAPPTASPPAESAQSQKEPDWAKAEDLILYAQGPLWAYFPSLEDQKTARLLQRRMMAKAPLYLLLPLTELENPDSYSLLLFWGQVVFPNVKVRFLPLVGREQTGTAFILITREPGQPVRVFVNGRPVEEARRYTDWWNAAWNRAVSPDPLEHAKRVYYEGALKRLGKPAR